MTHAERPRSATPSAIDSMAVHMFKTFDPTRPTSRHWKELTGAQREKWRDLAKSALGWMEQPDNAMLAAGARELEVGKLYDTRSNEARAYDVFVAMMVAALEG